MLTTALASALASASPFDFLFHTWSFHFMGKDVLSHDVWEFSMKMFKIGFALVCAGLLLIEARAKRLGEKLPERTTRRILIAVTIVGFLSYFDFFNPNVRYPDYYHRHEFYHYYLGSKYSHALGYTRLYECTMIAEVENGRGAQVQKREIRDLSVNLIRPVGETYLFQHPEECKKRFSPEEWTAFKKDVSWFESTARGGYWENMQQDHGYNPPPVWTAEGKLFASLAPAGDGFFKLLSLLDVALQAGTLAMIGWAFGLRVMAIASVFWGCNAVANFYWTGGAFLRQDWVFLLVASVCLARKKRYALSGAALTYSSLLRVFPMIAFAGWIIVMGLHLLKRKALHPNHKKVILGCVMAGGLLIPASMVVAGPESYREFVAHIRVHNRTPLTNHMGLETMLVHDWKGRMRFTRDSTLDDPFELWKQGRRDRFDHLKPVFFALSFGVFAWMAWALRRTKSLWIPIGLSIPLVISLTNLTCYYYCMFLAAVPLVAVVPSLGPALLVTSGASQIILSAFYFIDDQYTAESYLFYAMGLLLLYAYSRPFSVERLRAFLDGKREPKSGKKTATGTPATA
ncbi:MAG TPA: hypothetical protein VHE30_09200 [Polyangiaceae bacterium]|nr:hypothetical protein [Polyangiaceae bacterium]